MSQGLTSLQVPHVTEVACDILSRDGSQPSPRHAPHPKHDADFPDGRVYGLRFRVTVRAYGLGFRG